MGKAGTIIYNAKTNDVVRYELPVVPAAEVKSEVGAGDCFLAGYAVALTEDDSNYPIFGVHVGHNCACHCLRDEKNVGRTIDKEVPSKTVLDWSSGNGILTVPPTFRFENGKWIQFKAFPDEKTLLQLASDFYIKPKADIEETSQDSNVHLPKEIDPPKMAWCLHDIRSAIFVGTKQQTHTFPVHKEDEIF